MKRRQKRKVVWLVLLLLLLAFLGVWYANFRATKSVLLDLRAPDPNETVEAPTYLYSFAGDGENHLSQPIGVFVYEGQVYVSDGRLSQIEVFSEDGTFVKAFGKGTVDTPLYFARNPKDGNLYVTDRRKRAVFIFKMDGTFVSQFDPKLPKEELPKFDTKGDQWVPVGLDFGPDGRMYVIDLLNGHRLLVFSPDGAFERSIGSMGVAGTVGDNEGKFQFPNALKFYGGEVYVADSNNRRIQVFAPDGTFKRIIPASGLPRGIAFLPRPSNATSETTDKLVVVDTLSHDGTIFTSAGQRLINFGEQGVGEAQFSYPGDVAVGSRSLIFITDTMNTRVQVWGWQANLSPIPRVLPRQAAWYLLLLPLLLLPFLARKKKFYATVDFVRVLLEGELVHTMPKRNRVWFVSQADYDALKDEVEGDIRLGDLLNVMEPSRSDVVAIKDRLEVDEIVAATLAGAQRTKVLCTESVEIRRLARTMELDVVDSTGYLERFTDRGKGVK